VDEKLAYTIGLIGGDGSLICSEKESSLHIVDSSYAFHVGVIAPLFTEIFGMKPKISPMRTKQGRTTYRSRIRDKEIVRYYLQYLPARNKTFGAKTPKEILSGGKEVKASYVRGWMDAEGSVTTTSTVRKNRTYTYPKITFHVANEAIRNELADILQEFDIHFTIWDYRNMRGFQIVGKHTKRYFDLIGFSHPDKLLE
jgi:intein/homing endonuclease